MSAGAIEHADDWPDPLGHVTTDEPEWVWPQMGWQRGKFSGKVRGPIPDHDHKRDRHDRTPDLPENAFALTRVTITPPGKEAKHHVRGEKLAGVRPDGSWVVDLKYEQTNSSYTSDVYLFSSAIPDSPIHQHWKSAPHTRTERRRVEYFDTIGAAKGFVTCETGLVVPERGGGQ